MVFILYSLGIRILHFLIWAGSFFSGKLRLLHNGRKQTMEWLASPGSPQPEKKVVWMHCSSLGEFEQGRPVLEALHASGKEIQMYLSFFSPSGFEIRKNWEVAEKVFYLPADTRGHAEKLIQKIQPDVFIMVKYDFWWNLLRALQLSSVPVVLIAALYKPGKYYFTSPFIQLMKKWNRIFTMREISTEGFRNQGLLLAETAGDPRVDRVISIRDKGVSLPHELHSFCTRQQKILVYGSIWEADVFLVAACIKRHPEWSHLVVPHDVTSANVAKIRNRLGTESDVLSTGLTGKNVVIADKVGFLNGLYAYADLAYIGGGFGKGIHNTLEAAVFGIPVCFGPKYQSFPEAVEFVKTGAGFMVDDAEKFVATCEKYMENSEARTEIQKSLDNYFEKNRGATQKIVTYIQNLLFHTDRKA